MNPKCDYCGKIIATKELENGGGASYDFLPDSEITTETHAFRCKRCTESHGKVHLYIRPNQR